MSRSILPIAFAFLVLSACAKGESAPANSREPQIASAPAREGESTPSSAVPAAASADSAQPAATATGEPSAPTKDSSTSSASAAAGTSGSLLDLVHAAVRARYPKAASTRIAEVRSQAWGGKHLVLTISEVSDPASSSSSVIGIHVFNGDFGTLLKTLDVFVNIDDSWPAVHRLAADSVVVHLKPEKAERGPQHRKAYEWRSIEEQ